MIARCMIDDAAHALPARSALIQAKLRAMRIRSHRRESRRRTNAPRSQRALAELVATRTARSADPGCSGATRQHDADDEDGVRQREDERDQPRIRRAGRCLGRLVVDLGAEPCRARQCPRLRVSVRCSAMRDAREHRDQQVFEPVQHDHVIADQPNIDDADQRHGVDQQREHDGAELRRLRGAPRPAHSVRQCPRRPSSGRGRAHGSASAARRAMHPLPWRESQRVEPMPHANLELNEPIGDEVKTTTCYMCACRCGINVHLKDGRVRYIEGNPAHPVNRGVLCAKGSAGIMQHYSPARLTQAAAARRRARHGRVPRDRMGRSARARDQLAGRHPQDGIPDELAFFTGRDQSQALTGWWAQQFGTINYAAHGGFCSVNMAAAGMYTLGGSFWEFGEPDWEHDEIPDAVGRRRGPRFQSDQARPRQAQGTRRQDRRRQSGAHRLRRDRRRMDRHPSRHRRPVRRRADPRAAAHRSDRPRLSGALHECALSRDPRARARPTTACSRATPKAARCAAARRSQRNRDRRCVGRRSPNR